MDPKLVAAAFGMTAEAVMIYLADHIDDGRLPEPELRQPGLPITGSGLADHPTPDLIEQRSSRSDPM
jgi:hypothetical protein